MNRYGKATALILMEPPSSGSPPADFTSLRKVELARFLERAQRAAALSGKVNLLLAGDERLCELNRSFRHKNRPTDVLSFPAVKNPEGIVGDLAISVETAARQATEHGHTLQQELHILILHGVLHLAGFDHETDDGEMREREAELRSALQLPTGLIERVETRPVRRLRTRLRASGVAAT